MNKKILAPLAVGAVASTVLIWTSNNDAAPDVGPGAEHSKTDHAETVYVESLEQYNLATADDWTRHSDVIATVSVDAEAEAGTPPETSNDLSADDGYKLVGRTVTISVKNVVWLSEAAPRELPQQLNIATWGWLDDGSTRVAVVDHGRSRLLPGNTYLVALRYADATCSIDDGNTPAGWELASAAAAIPMTDGVLGQGEVENRKVAKAEYQSLITDPEALKSKLAGVDISEAKAMVSAAGANLPSVPRRVVDGC